MCGISDKNSDGGSKKIREPEEIVVFNKKVGDDGIEDVVKDRHADADKEITPGMLWLWCSGRIHRDIISYANMVALLTNCMMCAIMRIAEWLWLFAN